MENYSVAPEDCLILLAVKNSKSLREAARSLNCDPGGLLRKVQRISSEHGFLKKVGGRWQLTSSGQALTGWTQETILSQKRYLATKSTLRFAATTWFAEELLIPALSELSDFVGGLGGATFSVPGNGFEEVLIEGDSDFVIVCHPPENPLIAHKVVGEEEWAVVLSVELAQENFGRKKISLASLSALSFIRHNNLNPYAIFPEWKAGRGDFQLAFDNLVGVRAAVRSSQGWSFVPRVLVQEDLALGRMLSVEHAVKMDRKVCLWWLRSHEQNRRRSSGVYRWIQAALSRD